MVFGHFAGNGQAYTRAPVFSVAVQALEHLEDALGILDIEPYAVVGHFYLVELFFPCLGRKLQLALGSFYGGSMDVNDGRLSGLAVLQRIAQQV